MAELNVTTGYKLHHSCNAALQMLFYLSFDKGPCRCLQCVPLQIRNALAVASVLGRTLVLPDLWCGADRWWAPHQGTIPGSALLLPFRCPADHVLDLGRWDSEP